MTDLQVYTAVLCKVVMKSFQLLDYMLYNFSVFEGRHHCVLNSLKHFFPFPFTKVKKKNLCNIILGILVEFCDNPKTTSHISTWRGEKDQTAASLLIQLWRQEELDLGIKRDRYGRIVGKFYDACETVSSYNE